MALPVLRHHRLRRNGRRRADVGHLDGDRWTDRRNPSPWAEFGALHERMGHLLSETLGETFGEGGGWRPAADVEETAEAYLVELELPGVKRQDVSVQFGGGELAVTGEVKQRERVGFLRSRTRPVGRFDYRVSLPAEVEDDQVTASLADGVLTVRVPKTERARPRKIPISSS